MAFERNQFLGTPEFNSGAVGNRRYGLTGSSAATTGPVDKAGYAEREQRAAARRRAIQNRLQMGGAAGSMVPGQGGL